MQKNNITVGDLINHLNKLPKDSIIKYAVFGENSLTRKEYDINLNDILYSKHDIDKKVLICLNL
jgi:hypothetical protein